MTRIGISACLLGDAVRYDGGHKRADALLDESASRVRWIPVCPEVELGLGVPRPPIRLETDDGGSVRLVPVDGDGPDHGPAMAAFATARLEALVAEALDGFVCKARSPSCGVGDAPLHGTGGRVVGHRDGAFVEVLRRALPDLPVVTEAEIDTPAARARFLARCEAYGRRRSNAG